MVKESGDFLIGYPHYYYVVNELLLWLNKR